MIIFVSDNCLLRLIGNMTYESKSRNITWENTNPGPTRLLAQAFTAFALLEVSFHILPVPGDPIMNGVRVTRAAIGSILFPHSVSLFPSSRGKFEDSPKVFLKTEAESANGRRVRFVESLGYSTPVAFEVSPRKELRMGPGPISFTQEVEDSPH
jgi:hypothetical protein